MRGEPIPWLVRTWGSLGAETKSRLAPSNGATCPPPILVPVDQGRWDGAETETQPRPCSQPEPFLQLHLPYHPTFFLDTPYFLYFSIRVKYTEHKTDQWNHVCVQFSGIQHINTVVQPSPPSLSRTFLPSHTQTLSPGNTASPSPPPAPHLYFLLQRL